MREGSERHSLSIVIPALNEEEAIGDTVRRCLEAREEIAAEGGLAWVEVLVVSDGSTDRTEAIARSFQDISVLAFEQNRGYGAAIQCGFAESKGSLLGFLDADGTCDPLVFGPLCRAIVRDGADLALGSRVGPGTQMPLVRRIGNRIFAWILGVLSQRSVKDSASGMRVIRRDRLPDVYPLPDGLHFTPAMSARVLIEDKLRLAEVPMPYAERVGRSKLSAVRDGVRFLRAILQAAVCYRPARPLLLFAAFSGVAAALFAAVPVAFYLGHGRLEEWMIYRLMVASLLATWCVLLVCAAVVAEHISATAYSRPPAAGGVTRLAAGLFTTRMRTLALVVGGLLALAVVWPGIVEYLESGRVTMHWSRALLASLLLAALGALSVTTFLLNMMQLIRTRGRMPAQPLPPDRIRRPSPGAP